MATRTPASAPSGLANVPSSGYAPPAPPAVPTVHSAETGRAYSLNRLPFGMGDR